MQNSRKSQIDINTSYSMLPSVSLVLSGIQWYDYPTWNIPRTWFLSLKGECEYMPFIQFKEFITGNNLEWLRGDENKKDRKIQFKI